MKGEQKAFDYTKGKKKFNHLQRNFIPNEGPLGTLLSSRDLRVGTAVLSVTPQLKSTGTHSTSVGDGCSLNVYEISIRMNEYNVYEIYEINLR